MKSVLRSEVLQFVAKCFSPTVDFKHLKMMFHRSHVIHKVNETKSYISWFIFMLQLTMTSMTIRAPIKLALIV